MRGRWDDRSEDLPDLAEQRVAELVAGAIVHLFEVVAVEHPQAERSPCLLRDGERALELKLEAATIEQTRELISESAAAFTSKRKGGIDRGSCLRGKHGCHLGRLALDIQGPTARADEDSQVVAVRS